MNESKCNEDGGIICYREGIKVCYDPRVICDEIPNCDDGSDEDDNRWTCEDKYKESKLYAPGSTFKCHKSYRNITKKNTNETSKFITHRAVPFDGVAQCPLGEDEDPPSIPQSLHLTPLVNLIF